MSSALNRNWLMSCSNLLLHDTIIQHNIQHKIIKNVKFVYKQEELELQKLFGLHQRIYSSWSVVQ